MDKAILADDRLVAGHGQFTLIMTRIFYWLRPSSSGGSDRESGATAHVVVEVPAKSAGAHSPRTLACIYY